MSFYKKLCNWLIGDVVTFKVYVPVWFLLMVALLPVIAYGDLTLIGRTNFWGYLLISALEVFLLYLGFLISHSTFRIKSKGKK